MAHIGALTLYPIKALDGVSVERTTIAPHLGLAADREYAIFDADGRLVNGKRTAAVHAIRARYDLTNHQVTLQTTISSEATFAFGDRAMDEWLSEYFGFAVMVRHSASAFPDHRRTPGPTVVSSATLNAVADSFGISIADVRRRFRANIEIDGTQAFEEDRAVTSTNGAGIIQCGDVRVHAIEHCERCVVPSRDPMTGVATAAFAKRLATLREAMLPEWTDRKMLPHFYHLCIVTRVPVTEVGKTLAIGDAVHFEDHGGGRRTILDAIKRALRKQLGPPR